MEGGNPENPEKTLEAKERINNKLNSHLTVFVIEIPRCMKWLGLGCKRFIVFPLNSKLLNYYEDYVIFGMSA
jgi:hypothetical protein